MTSVFWKQRPEVSVFRFVFSGSTDGIQSRDIQIQQKSSRGSTQTIMSTPPPTVMNLQGGSSEIVIKQEVDVKQEDEVKREIDPRPFSRGSSSSECEPLVLALLEKQKSVSAAEAEALQKAVEILQRQCQDEVRSQLAVSSSVATPQIMYRASPEDTLTNIKSEPNDSYDEYQSSIPSHPIVHAPQINPSQNVESTELGPPAGKRPKQQKQNKTKMPNQRKIISTSKSKIDSSESDSTSKKQKKSTPKNVTNTKSTPDTPIIDKRLKIVLKDVTRLMKKREPKAKKPKKAKSKKQSKKITELPSCSASVLGNKLVMSQGTTEVDDSSQNTVTEDKIPKVREVSSQKTVTEDNVSKVRLVNSQKTVSKDNISKVKAVNSQESVTEDNLPEAVNKNKEDASIKDVDKCDTTRQVKKNLEGSNTEDEIKVEIKHNDGDLSVPKTVTESPQVSSNDMVVKCEMHIGHDPVTNLTKRNEASNESHNLQMDTDNAEKDKSDFSDSDTELPRVTDIWSVLSILSKDQASSQKDGNNNEVKARGKNKKLIKTQREENNTERKDNYHIKSTGATETKIGTQCKISASLIESSIEKGSSHVSSYIMNDKIAKDDQTATSNQKMKLNRKLMRRNSMDEASRKSSYDQDMQDGPAILPDSTKQPNVSSQESDLTFNKENPTEEIAAKPQVKETSILPELEKEKGKVDKRKVGTTENQENYTVPIKKRKSSQLENELVSTPCMDGSDTVSDAATVSKIKHKNVATEGSELEQPEDPVELPKNTCRSSSPADALSDFELPVLKKPVRNKR